MSTGVAVTPSITAAPWEKPPSTIRVSGQVPATYCTRALASATPLPILRKFRLAG